MFVGNSRSSYKSGNIETLRNIDYYKRYIIIEIPDSTLISSKSQISIINISCSTGKGIIGHFSASERRQNHNIYHGEGIIFSVIPHTITNDIYKFINQNSIIHIKDISYGSHIYDLSRSRLSELRMNTSYNDMVFDDVRDNIVSNIIPFPKFYNMEHHIINEEKENSDIPYGYDTMSSGNVFVRFGDLVDKNTSIYITRKSNFNKITTGKYIHESEFEIPLDTLATLIIGPCTNLMIGLLVNELDFCYEINDNESKISRIRFKTDHKQPNEFYSKQISGNFLSQFEQDMEFVKDYANVNFKLFVHCMIGNVRLRFIIQNFNGISISRDFNYDIGASKNVQNDETVNWIHSTI